MGFDELEQMMLDACSEHLYTTSVTLRVVTRGTAVNPVTASRAETVSDTAVRANRLPVRTIPGPGGAGKEREWTIVIHRHGHDGSTLATPPAEGHRIVLDKGTAAELVLNIASVDVENGGKSFRCVCRRVNDKSANG